MAIQFLSWQENLDEDEQPPRPIWFSPQELRDWFAQVKKRRDEKSGGDDSAGPIDDPVENQAAKGLIVGD